MVAIMKRRGHRHASFRLAVVASSIRRARFFHARTRADFDWTNSD
ncbi:hypothetical protein ACVWWN_000775 [Mycobacterium sp. URHB0021]